MRARFANVIITPNGYRRRYYASNGDRGGMVKAVFTHTHTYTHRHTQTHLTPCIQKKGYDGTSMVKGTSQYIQGTDAFIFGACEGEGATSCFLPPPLSLSLKGRVSIVGEANLS